MRFTRFRPLTKRAIRFMGVGTFVLTPLSFGIFLALIHWAHMDVIDASVTRAFCMLLPAFMAARYFTWRDRRRQMSVWRQAGFFLVGWAVSSVLHQSILIVSVWSGVHYVAAYWAAVVLTGVFKFFWGDKVSFAHRLLPRQPSALHPEPVVALRAPGA